MQTSLKLKKLKRALTVGIVFAVIVPVGARSRTAEPDLHQLRVEKLSRSILAFDIANGSDLAAAALSDLHIRVWRLESGQLVHEFSFAEPETDRRLKLADDVEPVSLRFSPDGTTLAVSFLNAIYLYNVVNWREEKTLTVAGEDRLRPDITVTPDRPQLARRSAEAAKAEKSKPAPNINQTMRELSALRDRGDGRTRILSFAFSKDGSSILASYCRSACFDSTWLGSQWMLPSGSDPVRFWDLSSMSVRWERLYDAKGVISRVALSPDSGRFIGVNSQLGRCAVGAYDLGTGQTLWSHSFGSCLGPPAIVMFPDGQSFITNRVDEANRQNRKKKLHRYAAIYDPNTGKKIVDLPEANGISQADISSDGRWLASITWTGTQLQIWDLQTKKIAFKELPKGWERTADCVLNRVRFSPDNHWLIVGCNMRGDVAIYKWGEDNTVKQ